MLLVGASFINALLIFYFAGVFLKERLKDFKLSFLKLEKEYSVLSAELKVSEESNNNLADEEAHIASLYQITKCLTLYMDEDELFKVFKEELARSNIKFLNLEFVRHKAEISKYKDYEVFDLYDRKKSLGFFLIKGLNQDYKKDFEMLVKRFSFSIKRFRLYDQLQKWAIADSLTGLYSKSYCLERLNLEFTRSKEFNLSLSVAMLDLDDFKALNDRYGHLTGDVVLRDTAKIIKSSMRNIDFIGRFGGEEFLIIMPEAEKNGSKFAAERIRREVENCVIKAFGQAIKVTLSIGIANFPVDADSPAEIIEKADQALYLSKKNGKNRITLFGVV
jgi:diguanylate cyclase (GGDEF)-like protein